MGRNWRHDGKQVFSDGPQIPLDPAGRPNIGGIPWTVGQAVLSLSAYAYQKAVSLVLAEPFNDPGEATFVNERGGFRRIEPSRLALQFLGPVLGLLFNPE